MLEAQRRLLQLFRCWQSHSFVVPHYVVTTE